MDTFSELDQRTRVALYYQASCQYARTHCSQFLSGCMDKSNVQAINMQLTPLVSADNVAWRAPPQDYLPPI